MSYVRIWVHAVWGTKNREHTLIRTVLPLLLSHIRQNASHKHIHIDTLNGSSDHLHCLLGLNADMTIARTIQLIKGESALHTVRQYVNSQEEHHRKKSYAEEVENFLHKYNFPCHG